MSHRTIMLGMFVTLVFATAPAAAQSFHVDVGVHAGPVAGRVIYGPPPVYVDHGVYVVDHHRHHRVHGRHHPKHKRHWHRAHRDVYRHHRHAHRLHHAHAHGHGRCYH